MNIKHIVLTTLMKGVCKIQVFYWQNRLPHRWKVARQLQRLILKLEDYRTGKLII